MADTTERKCPMDCSKCTFRQNIYCSSQIALANNVLLREIKDQLAALQLDSLIEPMAQNEEAAQIIDSQDNETKK